LRLISLVLLALTFVATGVLPASANAFDDLGKMQAAMNKLHSYKSSATWSQGARSITSEIEAVNPDRYHASQMDGALQFIVVGAQYWAHTAKQGWIRLAAPPVSSLIGNVLAVMHFNNPSTYIARNLGMRNGYQAVLVESKDRKSQSTVYLRPDHLVALVEIKMGKDHGRITYGAYNAPISIQPPTK